MSENNSAPQSLRITYRNTDHRTMIIRDTDLSEETDQLAENFLLPLMDLIEIFLSMGYREEFVGHALIDFGHGILDVMEEEEGEENITELGSISMN